MPRAFLTIVGLGLITGALCSSTTASEPARRTESSTTSGNEQSKITASHPVAPHGTGHASSRIVKSPNSNLLVPPPPPYTPAFAAADYLNDSGNVNPKSNGYDSSSQANARARRSWAHSIQSRTEKARLEKERRVKRFAGTSFDEQLKVIADSGIKLASDRVDKIRSIVAENKELYDEDPMLFLLNIIASKDDEGTQYSSNICSFDAECIYKDGDYKAIVDNLAAICEGQMPVQHIEDSVVFSGDEEGGKGAHVQFDLDGKSHKFELKVNNDWVDPSIFDKIGTLFSERTNGAKALWYLNFGGHVFGAICLSPDQAKEFENQTLLTLQMAPPASPYSQTH